ncbi:deoxyribose-phosphate aldolase [Budvicia aquatica]|uniref:Deoxyribose-phosphate aldolase n=2 Tax=Budvicia aquatica TaxID=82979 RepID=A0A2C6DJJ9_9GAMM|nr:deoxyribose-phosphate aldolase [Budvicia aquatica]MBP9643720.1 deoxyribose-phosphate aldolase [Budvicia sp.]PHI28615.1 deoxyribose-phosphate aldolase [Budvicia aquatica]GKX52478.1 deoxyribose-phosphate aldolase [Budvicia aquatica]
MANVNIAKMIDHTLLKADAKKEEILKLCGEAKQYGFKSVCINPGWVNVAAKALAGSDVEICTVIGFPLGANTPETKAFETGNAIANGATEVDMVLNIGALKAGDSDAVLADIQAVVDAAARASKKVIVKVILETCLLTDAEKELACQLCVKAGADFVKTSTGFSTGGATVADIQLMRKTVGPDLGVKASGGVRSLSDVEKMMAAGANRMGASAGIAIVTDTKVESGGY